MTEAAVPLTEHTNILEASGLGKPYRSTWARRECTLAIPAGFVTALVGPNGALVLDEPVAMPDPIARHDFMATVLAASAKDGVSVLLSSHVLTELEWVASYLVLRSRGQVRLTGTIEDLLATIAPARKNSP
jgi:ABC-type multidrug transport system ATPase subunit